MNKDTNVIFRLSSELKESATTLAKKNGYTLSEVIVAGLCDICKKGFIPISYNSFLPHRNLEKNIVTVTDIKKALNKLIEEYGKGLIKKVYLFGSYSRGDEKPSSDIDLRIEADDGLSLIDLGNIRTDLSSILKKEVDLIAINKEEMDPLFLSNIKKDEICIYER